jgi:hypothetical protein
VELFETVTVEIWPELVDAAAALGLVAEDVLGVVVTAALGLVAEDVLGAGVTAVLDAVDEEVFSFAELVDASWALATD